MLCGKQSHGLFYDVACDQNGKLHKFPQSSLLLYANESAPEMMQQQKFKGDNQSNNGNYNDNTYLFAVQRTSLSAVFHPDGTLHYASLPGIKTFL